MSTVALYSEMKKSFSINKQRCIKEAIQGNMLCVLFLFYLKILNI